MFGKTQSTTAGQALHSLDTHQNPPEQSASVRHAQLAQSSEMVREPLAQTADQVQQGRGAVEQLKVPVHGPPLVPRARAS
jgi:hypothetical protein